MSAPDRPALKLPLLHIRNGKSYANQSSYGAVISGNSTGIHTLDRLFILPEEQGKGYGFHAWMEIENMYPDAKEWTLRTPTCLINNVCFYVNKCGFTIVRVEDMGKDGVGMYVFSKKAS